MFELLLHSVVRRIGVTNLAIVGLRHGETGEAFEAAAFTHFIHPDSRIRILHDFAVDEESAGCREGSFGPLG